MKNIQSPERLYVNWELEQDSKHPDLVKHISRYRFASQFIGKEMTVLDIACGSGYGSACLAEKASFVTGFDKDKSAIDFAIKHNFRFNTNFSIYDFTTQESYGDQVDAVVSLETLEHISRSNMLDFMTWCTDEVIAPNGIFIGSTPMLRFRDGKPYVTNPFHINEMVKKDLLDILWSMFHCKGWEVNYFAQHFDHFLPLTEEHTGFCIFVARKIGVNK